MAWNEASDEVVREIGKKVIEAVNSLDGSTSRLNKIMIGLNIVLVLLTVVLVLLTFKLSIQR